MEEAVRCGLEGLLITVCVLFVGVPVVWWCLDFWARVFFEGDSDE